MNMVETRLNICRTDVMIPKSRDGNLVVMMLFRYRISIWSVMINRNSAFRVKVTQA